jgi:Beta protein
MAVVAYMPILKARVGELLALDHAGPAVTDLVRPLLEVMQRPSKQLYGSVLDFGDRLMAVAPKGMVFAVDCRYLRTAHTDVSDSPLSLVSWDVHDRGICMIPVLSPGDGQDPAEVRSTVARHKAGACLRLGMSHLARVAGGGRGDAAHALLAAAGLGPAEVDVVIDLGEVCTEAALERAVRLGRAALTWARQRPWRSVTVAAGAFPDDIGDFPVGTSTPVPRWDAVLWSELAATAAWPEGVGYGDYAVSSPRLLGGRAPLPNLRYASKRHWHVYRYPKTATGALSSFHDLCQTVTCSGHWPAQGRNFSWGDEQVDNCARRLTGPGNATLWRAYGTSHHLAVVADRLSELGEP